MRSSKSTFWYWISDEYNDWRSFAALTRGPKSLKPCTVCLVPREDLIILTNEYELRTAKKSHEVVMAYHDMKKIPGFSADAEEMIKDYSLRPLKVSWFSITSSNCHAECLVRFLGFWKLWSSYSISLWPPSFLWRWNCHSFTLCSI